MARRNRNAFSQLVAETKLRVVALLTAKGKMTPVSLYADLAIDESLGRTTLGLLRNDGIVESTGRFYQVKSQQEPFLAPCAVPAPAPMPVSKADPEPTKTEKALALVRVENGALVTDSLIVAEVFGKRHDDVLRSIDNLECSQGFRLRNFAESNYLNSQGKSLPCVDMTRDGFIFLAMGFTGAEAARWKEAFIVAFNDMETALLKSKATLEGILERMADMQEKLTGMHEMQSLVVQNGFGVMNTKIEVVDGKVDRLNYRVTEVESIAGKILRRGRKKISPKVKNAIYHGIKEMGGYCPCCGVVKIIDKDGFPVNSEDDHFYENSLSDVEHVWTICKSCHKELTTGKVARMDREDEFKAFQSKLKRIKPQAVIEFG
jgi:Rha family phage regulatory protein